MAVLAVVGIVGLAVAHPEGGRIPGAQGRVATILIMTMALVPALGGVTLTLTRAQDVTAAVTLLVLVSAYEAADYIIGSGASNFIEGPSPASPPPWCSGSRCRWCSSRPSTTPAGSSSSSWRSRCRSARSWRRCCCPGRGRTRRPAPVDTLLLLAPIWAAAASAF